MYVVDSHCDSLGDILRCTTSDLIRPYNFSAKYPQLQFAAAFCGRAEETEAENAERAKGYIKAFETALKTHADTAVRVRSYADIEYAVREKKYGFMFTVEGAGKAITANRALVREFYDAGVRVIGLTWETNALAKSNRLKEGEEDTGLSEFGRDVAREMDSLGIIFDVSHLSDRSFYDIAELSSKPIIASHSNFRSVCAHTRNLTDDMARLIFEKDGMVGLNLYPNFISQNDTKKTVDGLFEHLDYGLTLGGEDHIGFGGDIDGTDGKYPYPLSDSESIHDKLIELMLIHNYSEALVRKIAGENYLAFLKKYL